MLRRTPLLRISTTTFGLTLQGFQLLPQNCGLQILQSLSMLLLGKNSLKIGNAQLSFLRLALRARIEVREVIGVQTEQLRSVGLIAVHAKQQIG